MSQPLNASPALLSIFWHSREDYSMAQWWIHFDLAGIQRYVFASRTLLDAIGRAAQVEDATDRAVLTAAAVLPEGVEVEFGAAGALILTTEATEFDNPEQPPQRVKDAVSAYTRWLYEVSDAFTPVVAIQYVRGGEEQQAHLAAADLLRQARHKRIPGVGSAVPPGVLRCALTGAPATDFLPPASEIPVAAEALTARRRGRTWHEAQQSKILASAPLPDGLSVDLPVQIDHLGRTEGASSHVAVLVIDVNDLGAALRTLPPDTLHARSAVADHLRALADELAEHLVHRVCSAIEITAGAPSIAGAPAALSFPLHQAPSPSRAAEPDALSCLTADRSTLDSPGEDLGQTAAPARWSLPLRPWVIAGDDLVLVCESRLAWDLATAAMNWIGEPATSGARTDLAGLGPAFGTGGRLSLTVGIGIAVVPVGYSLAAAHDLAAGLCKNAKKQRRDNKWTGHVLDWHRGPSAIADVLAHRARSDLRSGLRPYRYAPKQAPDESHTSTPTWSDVMTLLDADSPGSMRGPTVDEKSHGWASRRNWVKTDLLAAARSTGNNAVENALAAKNTREKVLTDAPMAELNIDGNSWQECDRANLIVDVIDLLDDHLDLTAAVSPS